MPRKAVRIYAKWNEAVGPWLGGLGPKGASLSETILSRVVDVRIRVHQKLHLLVIFSRQRQLSKGIFNFAQLPCGHDSRWTLRKADIAPHGDANGFKQRALLKRKGG